MADGYSNKTILTGGLTPEQIAEQKKREQDYDIVELCCKVWYETLSDGDVSRKKAIEKITQIVLFNINENHIYEKSGAWLLGEYIIKCHRERDVCTRKTVPTGWVRLAKEITEKRPGPKRSNAVGDTTVYEELSERLAEYGMDFPERTLRRWVEETK